jgi:hypothetical protein
MNNFFLEERPPDPAYIESTHKFYKGAPITPARTTKMENSDQDPNKETGDPRDQTLPENSQNELLNYGNINLCQPYHPE